MAALNENVKRYIVQSLACYDTPQQVAESVNEEFNIIVSRQQVSKYDPTKVSGKDLSEKWKTFFEDTREKFRNEISSIPIASQAYRLKQLQNIAQDAIKRKNAMLVTSVLEQAAKEVGGMFTNNRKMEHTSPDGSMTPKPAIDASKLSTETLRDVLSAYESTDTDGS